VLVTLERLVTVSKRMGITSISVSPDMIDTTRQKIAEVEKKLKIS